MIIRSLQGRLILVTQPDHADMSGQFAAHWGNSEFQEPEPLEDMIVAATAHDNGWWEQDTRPTVEPTSQQPHDFTTLPYSRHTALYTRGINRSIDDNPYAGLMVCMHGVGLYKQRYGTDPSLVRRPANVEDSEAVEKLINEQEAAQERLRGLLMESSNYHALSSHTQIWSNYKLLQIWDRLSLLLCWRGTAQLSLSPVPMSYGDAETDLTLEPLSENEFTVSPYPFRESPIEFHARARIIPEQPYDDALTFKKAFYRAPRTVLRFVMRRP